MLVFSARNYYRLFELYNAAVWPAHIVALALGLAVLFCFWRGMGRAMAVVLAVAWTWVALVFHVQYFSTITPFAPTFAAGTGLEAVLIAWTGAVRGGLAPVRDGSLSARVGLGIHLAALVGLPALGLAMGRTVGQTEIFALAPDPTALATIGLLLAVRRIHWHLLVIPFLWCVNTGVTLVAMKVPDALVVPALAAAAILLAAVRGPGRGRAGS
ncbi:MAG: DUF6064 family protein [Alphaproteobacteria bacterium]